MARKWIESYKLRIHLRVDFKLGRFDMIVVPIRGYLYAHMPVECDAY